MRELLSDPRLLAVWVASCLASLAVLVQDLRRNNRWIGGLMLWVWGLTVAYSGPLGLAGYFYSGRRQIARDTLWRRGFRSVAHCYSGCGAGEIVGVTVAAGLLSLGTSWVAGLSFALAYVAGFGLTVGPLVQEGVPFGRASRDAFYSETASITVMELTALGLDLWLAADATMHDPLFWSSLVVSLSAGLLTAYPVNVLLIHLGVKSGMGDPREAGEH